MVCFTSAQKKRMKRRINSVKKQQSKGIEIDTSKYDGWGNKRHK